MKVPRPFEVLGLRPTKRHDIAMTRAQWIGLAALLALAAGVRLALVFTLSDQPYFRDPVVDSAAYDRWAQKIAAGDLMGQGAFYQDPLYPYFLGGVYSLFGRDLLLVRILQIALGVAGCWLLFETARRIADVRVAFVALAIAALYKPFIFYDAALLKEFLAVVLVEAALFFLVLDRRWSWSLAGLSIGLAVLVRANLLLVGGVLALGFAFRRQYAKAALLACGVALAILPVAVRNARVSKDFVLTTYQLGPNFYLGNHAKNTTGRYVPPDFLTAAAPEFEERDFRLEAERLQRRPLKPSEVSRFWWDAAWAELDAGRFLSLTARRFAEYVNAYEVPDNYNYYFMERFSWVLRAPLLGFWFVAPFAAIGMIFAWRERSRWGWLYLFVAAYYASIVAFFVFARYRLPVLPPLLLFAALGLVRLFERSRERKWPWGAIAVGAVVLAQSAIPIGARDFRVAHYNLALHHFEHGRPAEAAAELEHVRDVRHASWIYLRGRAYEEAGRPERALEAFYEAAQLDPASADATLHLARAYRAVENLEEAIRWYHVTIRRDKNVLEAWLELGRVYRQKRDYVEAQRMFDAVAVVTWEGHLELALTYAEIGMWDLVVRECDAVLRKAPGQEQAIRLRAQAVGNLPK
jgi:tetratricopeptide (TPR) repeat protein